MSENNTNEIIVKKIIYGSIALWLGKKANNENSHKWCVYVRGIDNEDLSYFIKEVTFTLHNSFKDHVRRVQTPPFELYEVGWGEFDIKITVYLKDDSIKPIEFMHLLKLYPTTSHASMSTKKPVVSESYDEIILVNPRSEFKEMLEITPKPLNVRNYVQRETETEEKMEKRQDSAVNIKEKLDTKDIEGSFGRMDIDDYEYVLNLIFLVGNLTILRLRK